MRYPFWHKKRGDGPIAPALINLGKKLLARLDEQRRLSGVKTLQAQASLPDGSIVRAAFYDGVPLVDYQPALSAASGLTPLCSLFMDSGILDLGTNTAASVTLPPTFADAAPTLYSGASAEVAGTTAGRKLTLYGTADGRFQVIGEMAGTEPVASRAAEAAAEGVLSVSRVDKLQCQAAYPASVYTGLCQRFVQALYGSERAAYRAKTSGEAGIDIAYAAGTSTFRVNQAWGTGDTGLVDPDGSYTYAFVVATATALSVIDAAPTTPCGVLLQKALRAGAVLEQHRRRIEAYLLADLRPGTTGYTLTFTTPITGSPFGYGWKFNERGSELAVVTFNNTSKKTRVWRRQLARDASTGRLVVTEVDEAEVALPQRSSPAFPGEIAKALAGSRTHTSAALGGASLAGVSWDAPVYCYYIQGPTDTGVDTLEVVYSFLSAGGAVVSPGEGGCGSAADPNDPICVKDEDTTDQCAYETGADTINVAMGYYTARYSSVRVVEIEVELEPETSSNGVRQVLNLSWSTEPDYEAARDYFGTASNVAGAFDGWEAGIYPHEDWAPLMESSPPPANGWFETQVASAHVDPSCDCPSWGDSGTPHPTWTAPGLSCDPPLPGWSLTPSYAVTANNVIRRYVVLATGDSYTISQSRRRSSPTMLFIPHGSATGVYLRERDIDVNFVSVARMQYDAAVENPTNNPAGWYIARKDIRYGFSATGDCEYSGGGPTYNVPADGSANDFDQDYVPFWRFALSFPLGGAGTTSGTVRAGPESVRGTWLGATGAAVELDGATGSVYQTSGTPSVVSDAPAPSCGNADMTLDGTTHAPLLQYGLQIVGAGSGYGYDVDIYAPVVTDGRGPMLALIGANFGEARFANVITMQLTHPVLPLEFSAGYDGASIQYPSFVGYA